MQTWLVDFDETLATSSITWAFQDAFPKFTREHGLRYDAARLEQVMLVLQERITQNPDVDSLLHFLFEQMDWPAHLEKPFLADLMSGYQPALFDDALPFLERLRDKKRQVYIVSNNRRTPDHVRLLGVESYISGIFTPFVCEGTQPKPHASLWEYLLKEALDVDPETSVVVGDDPWSDGAFADACGLTCWIIDRRNRFASLRGERPYRWIQSLHEIPV